MDLAKGDFAWWSRLRVEECDRAFGLLAEECDRFISSAMSWK
nr:hypothetical protein [Hassalia byssoidea]